MNKLFPRQGGAFKNDLNRSMAALVGIAEGMLCDGCLNDQEIHFLKDWLAQNESIAAEWPGQVVYARVQNILVDGIVTNEERAYLVETLHQLIGGDPADLAEASHVTGLAFDHSASVTVLNNSFCLTGDFVFASRTDCEIFIRERGGIVSNSVTKKLTYLVVGGRASKDWKHGSFGTKIAKAVEYKDSGAPILIVSEKQCAAVFAAVG